MRETERIDEGPVWTKEDLLALGRSYQGAAVLGAAADLDMFAPLSRGPRTAGQLSRVLRCNECGLAVLLDALVALKLVTKSRHRYQLPPPMKRFLLSDGKESMLAMAQHQANCLRRWAQLARVVKNGRPAQVKPSIRGRAGDRQSFIGAMDNISGPHASEVIRAVKPLRFRHLLDVGGASGTWTMAFLRACPSAKATLFDLAPVIPMARRRLTEVGLAGRVKLVAGDFLKDPLPAGADLVWVSAIIHQNSRAQNRALFAQVSRALTPGGRIAIRDVVMETNRTRPLAGALFAVNMLVATEGGGTFTFGEIREDLEHAGFTRVTVAHRHPGMNSIIVARRGERLNRKA